MNVKWRDVSKALVAGPISTTMTYTHKERGAMKKSERLLLPEEIATMNVHPKSLLAGVSAREKAQQK